MVKIAERSAAETGVQNLRCRVSRAEELPFEANTFDAVVCRFGIMFFSDPVKAVREALRVLKPGCSVGYVVWGPRVKNPFHAVVQDVLDQYVPGPAPDPDAPGAYRYAPSGKLAAIVREAGAEAVEEKPVRFNVEAPSPSINTSSCVPKCRTACATSFARCHRNRERNSRKTSALPRADTSRRQDSAFRQRF
jgi:SAM-dependent methyltransferase